MDWGVNLGFKLGALRSALLSEAGRRHCDIHHHNISVLVSLSSVSTHSVIKNLSCASFCDGFGEKMTEAFLAHFLSSIFFFCTPPFCSPTPSSLFICFPACSSHLWCLDHLAFAPTFLPFVLFLPGSLPCNTSLSGRPVRLQELCEQSPGCQSKGWSLHSDQCHDRDESVPLAVSPVQSCRVHQQPPRPCLQPGQWGGHRKTQGWISW